MNQKTSLQKSLFPRLSLKAISLFTVIVFLCSDFLSFPPQALAYEKPTIDNRLSTTDQGSGFQSPVFGLQSEVMVPSEIGTITEASLPQTIDHRLLKSRKMNPLCLCEHADRSKKHTPVSD